MIIDPSNLLSRYLACNPYFNLLQDEKRVREILRFANACGAITTTKKGAIPALPSEADVEALIKAST